MAENDVPPQNASGKEEARKQENPASTHNDPSNHHGEPIDEEFSLMPPANSVFAKSH